MIRQVKENPENRRWCVFSDDGKKNLGCGSSEEWAKKRLGQVERFKREGNSQGLSGMEDGIDLAFKPPAAPDNAPAELKKLLQSVYSASGSSALAWGAVKKHFKQKNKKWIRRTPVSLGCCFELDGLAFTKTSTPHTYEKSVMSEGVWVHPLTGKKVEITEERLSRARVNLLKFGEIGVKVPFPAGHTLEPTANLGWWDPKSAQIKEIDGRKHLVMGLTVTDTKAQEKVANGSLEDVSVFWVPEFTLQTGEELEDVILHVCATSYPVLNDQPTFKALIPDGLSGEKEVSFLVYKQEMEKEKSMELLEAARQAFGEVTEKELIKKLEAFDLVALQAQAKKAEELEGLDLEALKKSAEALEALKKAETKGLLDSIHTLSAEVGELMKEEDFEALKTQPDAVLKIQLKSLEAVAEARGIKTAEGKKDSEELSYLDYTKKVLENQGFECTIVGNKVKVKEKS